MLSWGSMRWIQHFGTWVAMQRTFGRMGAKEPQKEHECHSGLKVQDNHNDLGERLGRTGYGKASDARALVYHNRTSNCSGCVPETYLSRLAAT